MRKQFLRLAALCRENSCLGQEEKSEEQKKKVVEVKKDFSADASNCGPSVGLEKKNSGPGNPLFPPLCSGLALRTY